MKRKAKMGKYAAMAAEATDEWRANDGGLTWAARDVRYTGKYIDGILENFMEDKISYEDAMDSLDPTVGSTTGAEVDLLTEAQAELAGMR